MRKNPRHYLTAEQMRLLARHEGISVEELKKKFDRLVEKTGSKKAAPKRSAAKARTRTVANPGKLMDPQKFAESYYQSVLNRAMTVYEVYELAFARATDAKKSHREAQNYASAVRHRVRALIKKFPRAGRVDETAHYRVVSNPKKRRNEKSFGKIRRNPGHSLMSEAAERYHNGEFDSMPSALSHVAAERRGE
jgi:hypothetical protein